MTCEWALSTSPGRSPVFTMEDPVSGVENPVNMDNPVNPVENPVNPVNPVKNPVTTQENSTESVASPVLPVVNPINRVEQVYELPGGWVKKIIPRKSGTSQGQWDAYLFTPDGTKIRSNQDLIKYLAATGLQIDPYVINMDKSCVKDKEGGRSKPSKGVMVLRDALRRMASGEQVTPDNSFRGFKDPNAPAVTSSSSSYAFEKSEYYSDAEVRLLPAPHEFTARQIEYLERQYEKLDPFPTPKVFRYLAKQLKVDQRHVESWFEEKNRPELVDDDLPDYDKPVKKHCILADDHGYANMIVGDGSEMVECEIDPCDIVIEVDEEDKC